MAQVGNRIVVAGLFSQVKDVAANGGQTFSRTNVFAFDATTGAVDRTFAPVVNGVVNTVLAGADGVSVYLGGTFTSLNGASSRNLVQVSAGHRRPDGVPRPAAQRRHQRPGAHRWPAGRRRAVHHRRGRHRTWAWPRLHPTTGALDEYMGVDVALHHNYPDRGTANAAMGVENFDVDARRQPDDRDRQLPAGRRAGPRPGDDGAAASPPAPSSTRTGRRPASSRSATRSSFDSWVRDVQFAPDGAYFVVVSTGGPYTGTLCDSATRWETAATGADGHARGGSPTPAATRCSRSRSPARRSTSAVTSAG